MQNITKPIFLMPQHKPINIPAHNGFFSFMKINESKEKNIYKSPRNEAEAEALGIATTVYKFDKESNKDFSTQAEALKDCDVVFMPFYYTEASLFIKKSVEKGSGDR